MKRFQFSNDEYQKLSTITGIAMMDLQKLDAQGLLANEVAVKLVFEYEYQLQQKENKVLPKLVIRAIARKYGLSVARVKKYLFAKESPIYYCEKCRQAISSLEFRRNNGICDQCVVESITL